MNETDFVKRGSDDWFRLRELALKIEKAPRLATPAELEEFLLLYRKTSADLARARAETSNPELTESLNNVLGLAYSALYRRPSRGIARGIYEVLSAGARAFRRQFVFVLLSLATLVTAGVVASLVLTYRPDLRSYIISPSQEELFAGWKKGEFEQRTGGESIMMTGFYAANNPRVAMQAAAVGAATFGVGSFVILWENGKMIGALSHEVGTVGKTGFLYSSIAPHGATELSGAVIAGASGYSLGWALIAPGKRRRLDSLRVKGKDALILLAMGVIMMYLAAPFEGFFSFNPAVPQPVKVVVAVIVFALWCVYWARFGRGEDARLNEELETTSTAKTLPSIGAGTSRGRVASAEIEDTLHARL